MLKPETINYRTYKPERDGLFCERIFGPVRTANAIAASTSVSAIAVVCDRGGGDREEGASRAYGPHFAGRARGSSVLPFAPKIGYLGIPSKKLEAIIYYERYVDQRRRRR